MRTLRSFESLITRLRLSRTGGGRVESLEFADFVQPVQIVDDVSAGMSPIGRILIGCTINAPAVVARFSYCCVSSVARPIKIRFIRSSVVTFLHSQATIDIGGVQTTVAGGGLEGPDLGVVATGAARPFFTDTAAILPSFANSKFTLNTVTVAEPAALPLLLPGQSILLGVDVVASASSMFIIWEEIGVLDQTTPALPAAT